MQKEDQFKCFSRLRIKEHTIFMLEIIILSFFMTFREYFSSSVFKGCTHMEVVISWVCWMGVAWT